MGKKSKNKQRKNQKPVVKVTPVAEIATTQAVLEPVSKLTPASGGSVRASTYVLDSGEQNRRDMKRIGLLLGTVVLLLIGLTILDQTTPVVKNLGKHFHAFMQL